MQGCIAIPAETVETVRKKRDIAVAATEDIGRHTVRSQRIERGVVHADHDVGGGRTAVGTRQGEPPRLLLPRLQVVAEGVPAHRELRVGFFELEVCRLLTQFAFVHEQQRDTQMMAEPLFVRHFEQGCLAREMQDCVADDAFLARQDTINPSLGEGCTHLETGRFLSRHHVARRIEPQVVLALQTLIGDGENGETCLERGRIALHVGFRLEVVMAGGQAPEHVGDGVLACRNEEVLHIPAVLREHAKHVALQRLVVARIEVNAPRLQLLATLLLRHVAPHAQRRAAKRQMRAALLRLAFRAEHIDVEPERLPPTQLLLIQFLRDGNGNAEPPLLIGVEGVDAVLLARSETLVPPALLPLIGSRDACSGHRPLAVSQGTTRQGDAIDG